MKEPDISDMRDIYDIKSIEPEARIFSDYLIYILIALVVAVIVYFVYRYLKTHEVRNVFRKKKKLHEEIDPAKQLLVELMILRKSKYWLSNEKKLHFSVLSDAVRRYIGLRYSFDANDMTTAEIDEMLGGKKSTLREECISLLKQADLVKFAKYFPSDAECSESISAAEKLVSR